MTLAMSPHLILWPVLVQILLTTVIYVRLAVVKRAAYAARQVDRSRSPIHKDAWPDTVRVVDNNLANQFQAPVLFYVLAVSLAILDAVDGIALGLAWGFALSRWGHAAVHVTSNRVPVRFRLFTVGVLCLVGLMGLGVRALLTA